MYMQGYNGFMPLGEYQQQQGVQGHDGSWQQGQQAPPPLPGDAPPPSPAEPMQPVMQQQPAAQQPGMQAWGQQQAMGQQQYQQDWTQQQGMGQQQWPGQMQQWQAAQPQQQWQGQQWQQPQQPQQPQPPPPPQQQPKAAGKDDWRQLWHQQLQQQQLQQQQQQQQQAWMQGMGMQQWGQQQGMPGQQQPYGGMYNQQQQGAMYNQYEQVQQPQPPQPQPPPPQQPPQAPYMAPSGPQQQQTWANPALPSQQGGPMGLGQQQQQQGAYGQRQMQQQQPQQGHMPLPSAQQHGARPTDYGRAAGMVAGAPALHQHQHQHQQHHQQQQPAPPPGPSPAAPAPPAVPARPPSPPRPLDLAQLLQAPGRASRPKRLLLLLRGPPGCGKSHLARTIRQAEVAAGGAAPRLHSLDDYFMVDVEQPADETGSGSSLKRRGGSGSSSGAAVLQQEYQHDPELEPSYWRSLLRATGKTLGEGLHPLVLLDAPALSGDQVREVWKVAQGAGAELLVVNPLTTDPEVCFKQNVHKHSLAFIQAQAKLFEPVPANFTSADASSLFQGKQTGGEGGASKQGASSSSAAGAAAGSINEVDMAVDDDPAAAAAADPGSSSDPAAALPTPSGKPRAKSSRWEDDSDEDLPAPAAAAERPGSRADAADTGMADRGDEAAAAAGRPKKKARLAEGLALDAFDAESLLAGVNQELELLDAAEAGTAAAAAAAGGSAAAAGRMGSGALGSGMSGGSGSSGGRLGGILKKQGTPKSRCKKVRVRWPDLSDQEAAQQQQGFSIAPAPKPLAEVYWVEGLGPSKELWMAEADSLASTPPDAEGGAPAAGAGVPVGVHSSSRNSFADQVRAEHRAEHDLFRAILLGHSSTPAGPSSAHKAPGSGGTGASGSQSRMFMQQRQSL